MEGYAVDAPFYFPAAVVIGNEVAPEFMEAAGFYDLNGLFETEYATGFIPLDNGFGGSAEIVGETTVETSNAVATTITPEAAAMAPAEIAGGAEIVGGAEIAGGIEATHIGVAEVVGTDIIAETVTTDVVAEAGSISVFDIAVPLCADLGMALAA